VILRLLGKGNVPMNHTTFRSTVAAAALALAAITGCTDDFTGINTNPNAPTAVSARYLLPAVITSSVDELLGTGLDRGVASLWVQHYARLQYTGTDRYIVEPNFSDGYWRSLYRGPVVDVNEIIERANDRASNNEAAVGMILKAWIFHNMTDLWGDIPYVQAGTGRDEGGTTTPAYDRQVEVYTGLLSQLSQAAQMIDLSEPGFGGVQFRGSSGNPDLLYLGDMFKWQLWANSLRLRIGMRLSEIDPGTAQSAVAAAVASGVFMSRAQEARLDYPGTPPNENPMYLAFKERPGDFRVSKTLVDTLKALNDPRLPIYAEPNADGEYEGMPNGLVDEHGIPFTAVSKVGEWFLRANTPAVIQSYEEVLFLQAEAAARGWGGGDPATLYAEAIAESMRRFDIDEVEIDAYLASPEVEYDPPRGMAQIALQKWIALYDQGPEAWAEWRRTGIPSLTPGRDNLNSDRVPVRFPYPSSEETTNKAQLQEALSGQGLGGLDSQLNTALWWDAR